MVQVLCYDIKEVKRVIINVVRVHRQERDKTNKNVNVTSSVNLNSALVT